MADITALKNRIRAAIKANDNQEITGLVLQQTLLDIVDELDLYPELENEAQQRQNGDNTEKARAEEVEQILQQNVNDLNQVIRNLRDAGYAFGGIAVTSTNPGVPTGNCFYIVKDTGTYTYFKNADNESIVLENDGIYVLTYESVENNYWEYNNIIKIDNVPTAGNNNLINSNGMFNYNSKLNTSVLRIANEKDFSTINSSATFTDKIFFEYNKHCIKKITKIRYKSINGQTKFYKVTYIKGSGTATFDLIKTVNNTEVALKEFFIDITLEENQMIGISGSFYFNANITQGYKSGYLNISDGTVVADNNDMVVAFELINDESLEKKVANLNNTYPFAEYPWIKEIYINPLGVSRDVGMLNNVNLNGNKYITFAISSGLAFAGKINYEERIGIYPIVDYKTGTITLGYAFIDGIEGAQQPESSPTKLLSYKQKSLEYSPSIAAIIDINTNEIGHAVGKTINVYDAVIVLASDGSGDYTTFGAAHTACLNVAGKALMLIKAGEYEIDAAQVGGFGYSILYDIKGIGDVTIKCIYEGNNQNIRTTFSPFNTTNSNEHQTVCIENITLIVSGVRYCVHDEFGALTTPSYTHIFKDCKFKHLSAPDEVWASPRCIGGGLGNKGLIIIENCEFESVISNSVDYHTGYDGGAQSSKVIVKNCVFANNTVSCTSTTYSSELSIVVIQDCILHSEPYYTDSNGNNDMKLITKNNIII